MKRFVPGMCMLVFGFLLSACANPFPEDPEAYAVARGSAESPGITVQVQFPASFQPDVEAVIGGDVFDITIITLSDNAEHPATCSTAAGAADAGTFTCVVDDAAKEISDAAQKIRLQAVARESRLDPAGAKWLALDAVSSDATRRIQYGKDDDACAMAIIKKYTEGALSEMMYLLDYQDYETCYSVWWKRDRGETLSQGSASAWERCEVLDSFLADIDCTGSGKQGYYESYKVRYAAAFLKIEESYESPEIDLPAAEVEEVMVPLDCAATPDAQGCPPAAGDPSDGPLQNGGYDGNFELDGGDGCQLSPQAAANPLALVLLGAAIPFAISRRRPK